MYYQNYDDYMRGMLGYSSMDQMNGFSYGQMYDDYDYQDLNEYYPDIYRVVYPAVCKECSRTNMRGFSRESLEDMVERIYREIEDVNFNSGNNVMENDVRLNDKRNVTSNKSELRSSDVEKKEITDNRETRIHMNSNLLKDFIKVLLIRELSGNRPNWICRPGQNCRPPFPGGSGCPGCSGGTGRPPMPPRPPRPY